MPRPEPARLTFAGHLFVFVLHLLPHHLLGRLMHVVTRSEWPPIKDWLIRQVITRFQVDLSTALEPDPAAYPSFNAFFTRALRAGARPIDGDPDAVCCPADGEVSETGTVTDGRLIQAKGWDYTLLELLGGDGRLAADFDAGAYATIYLSPRDYHRVHAPLACELASVRWIPGELRSVAPKVLLRVPRLFATNERAVLALDTPLGRAYLVMVGALNVGRIRVVGVETGKSPAKPLTFARGAELARFELGSTVVLVVPRARALAGLGPESALRLGQRLAELP